MKKIIITLFSSISVFLANPVLADAEIKEVCHDKVGKDGKPVNGKDGKPIQECKKIKVHKKLEGTEIPPEKGKK